MPFPDSSFDAILSSAAMEYLPEVGEAVSEYAMVLRPGGTLLIIATRDSFMGKTVAAHVEECMERAGIPSVEALRFPRYFAYFNWWGMALLGRKRAS